MWRRRGRRVNSSECCWNADGSPPDGAVEDADGWTSTASRHQALPSLLALFLAAGGALVGLCGPSVVTTQPVASASASSWRRSGGPGRA